MGFDNARAACEYIMKDLEKQLRAMLDEKPDAETVEQLGADIPHKLRVSARGLRDSLERSHSTISP